MQIKKIDHGSRYKWSKDTEQMVFQSSDQLGNSGHWKSTYDRNFPWK